MKVCWLQGGDDVRCGRASRGGECDDGALQGSELVLAVLGTAASMPREPCQVGFAYNFRGNNLLI